MSSTVYIYHTVLLIYPQTIPSNHEQEKSLMTPSPGVNLLMWPKLSVNIPVCTLMVIALHNGAAHSLAVVLVANSMDWARSGEGLGNSTYE
jgi:hypothetical protein